MKNFKSIAGKSERTSTTKPSDNHLNSRYKKMMSFRHSTRWRALSITIRNRWIICQDQLCEQPATSVHHIQDGYTNLELFYKEFNLIPLCEKHHRKADKQGIFEDIKMADYWKKKVNEYRETGNKD